MHLQKLEKAGRWLFGFTLAGGIVFSTSAIEFLPFIVGTIFLTALGSFPNFRREIRWRRMFLLSAGAMLVILGICLATLGMYYLVSRDNRYYTPDFFCYWTVWPLVDYDTGSGIALAYWLPLWMMKGLLFGFIIESFFALSKQRGVQRIEACVRRDSEAEGDVPPFGMAGILCMACLAITFMAMRFLCDLNSRLIEWLFPLLFIGPMATAFVILQRSSWQRELPARRRAVAIALRSSIIFGAVSMIVILMALMLTIWVSSGGLGTLRSRGEYGAF